MSKLTILLFIIFIVILLTLLSLNTLFAPNPVLKSLPVIFPTRAIVSESTLTLKPNVLKTQTGKQNTVQVLIDSRGEQPTLIQLELAYDPSSLGTITITPGPFFEKPQVVLNTINERNGRISYALIPSRGNNNGSSSNIVATLSIRPRIGAVKRETTLTFLPKTAVRTENQQNTLKSTRGTKVLLPQILIPEASTSAF